VCVGDFIVSTGDQREIPFLVRVIVVVIFNYRAGSRNSVAIQDETVVFDYCVRALEFCFKGPAIVAIRVGGFVQSIGDVPTPFDRNSYHAGGPKMEQACTRWAFWTYTAGAAGAVKLYADDDFRPFTDT